MDVLIIDDEKLIRWTLRERLEREGFAIREAEDASAGFDAFQHQTPDLVLLDLKLPDSDGLTLFKKMQAAVGPGVDLPVIVMTAYSTVDNAVEAMKLGAFDYLAKPFNMDELALTVRRAIETTALKSEVTQHVSERQATFGIHNIVGNSPAIREVTSLIRKVSESGASTVLVRGESGTGKDLVAKALHYESPRARKPFMNITCTALQDTLLESELFGHEKGSFTDARTQKKGLFELANGGTVFLDEIGDMSPTLQAKLLRVLEEKAFRRIGGSQDIRVDVRIVAATNRDLEKQIADKQFREDLYYRLNIITISMPSLRDRREDIPLLAKYFLRRFGAEFRKEVTELSGEALAVLSGYDWPGNVRELRNALERAVLLGTGTRLEAGDIVLGRQASAAAKPKGGRVLELPARGISLEDLEKDLMKQALERTHGNQTKAGELLGMTRDQVRYRLEKWGLPGGETPT